jgi:hypothetical protein
MRRTIPSVLVIVLLMQGCKKDASAQLQQKAEAAIDKALDAWVRGESPDKLTAIKIDDPDWKAGLRLLGFLTMESSPLPDSADRMRCRVAITLQDRLGKKVDREVVYVVQVGDVVVIVRTSSPPSSVK